MGQAAEGMPAAIEDLEVEKVLGKGFFGDVRKAKALTGPREGQAFAVKEVKIALVREQKLEAQLEREIKILYSLQHPRIVKLFFDFQDESSVYLGMEFASGGSVFDRLHSLKKLPPQLASRFFFETCQALDYLHHLPEKVIHRDIKPENLLLDGDDGIKLADFGWANLMPGNVRDTFCGTLDYLAPEMITAAGHDESVDMWMVGVLLYEMLAGAAPFGSKSQETTCRLILNVDFKFPEDFEPDAKDLVTAICRKKPRDRLQVRAALEHTFVTKFLGGEAQQAEDAALAEEGPSVMVQQVLEDTSKINDDMQILLQAKQQSEEALMQATAELEDTHFALQGEQKAYAKLVSDVAELETEQQMRERDLEEMRRQSEALQAELAKLNRGGRLSFPFRFGARSSGGAGAS